MSAANSAVTEKEAAMGRIGQLTVTVVAVAGLSVGAGALPAMAAGSTGVSTMRPFSDGRWAPAGPVVTRQPLSDGSWSPSQKTATVAAVGISTMRPFSDPNA